MGKVRLEKEAVLTKPITEEQLQQWRKIYEEHKNVLQPNRRTGAELLHYLRDRYVLTPIESAEALRCISDNVMHNEYHAEKLPAGALPHSVAFYLKNEGAGKRFYSTQNKDDVEVWGGDITRIFVGVDLASGFYLVEGSTLLWDELCAFQGLDERDLQNFAVVAMYVESVERIKLLKYI